MTMKLWEPKRTCPKAVPTHLQNHLVWSQTLKCSVKSYGTGPSTNCYFNKFLFKRVLKRINEQFWAFWVPWSPGFVFDIPPWSGFWIWTKWPWTMIYVMPCKKSILHSHTMMVPQAQCEVTSTGSTFPINDSAWSGMVTGSKSCVCVKWPATQAN